MNEGLTLPQIWPKDCKEFIEQKLKEGDSESIKQALQKIDSLSKDLKGPNVDIKILRTYTIENILPYFNLALSLMPCQAEIRVGAYDNIEPELYQNESIAAHFILWRIEEYLPYLFEKKNQKDLQQVVKDALQRLDAMAKWIEQSCDSPVYINTFTYPITMPYELLDVHSKCGITQVVHELNAILYQWSQKSQKIRLVDMTQFWQKFGNKAYDQKMDLFAKLPFKQGSFFDFATFLSRHLSPVLLPRWKVLAVDLDQTLWYGILGEDGQEKLKIGREYPGNIFFKIQQRVLSLKSSGIVLVLLSKNNLHEVEEAFSSLDMPLSLDDFVAIECNFNEKWKNLKKVAIDLSLGLDSFAFLDDQAFEREQMRHFLPEVNLLNESSDPVHLLNSLYHLRFDSFGLSQEDIKKHQIYKEEKGRKQLEAEYASPEDFLKSLQLKVTLKKVEMKDVQRVFQMLQKTNQFNLRTQRHSEEKVISWIKDEKNILVVADVKDRFGEQGIVGLAIALPVEKSEIYFIDSFLLSCRVIGRQVEKALWDSVLKGILKKGALQVKAEFLTTQKNDIVSNFFDGLGLKCIWEEEGNKQYLLQCSDLKLQCPKILSIDDWADG